MQIICKVRQLHSNCWSSSDIMKVLRSNLLILQSYSFGIFLNFCIDSVLYFACKAVWNFWCPRWLSFEIVGMIIILVHVMTGIIVLKSDIFMLFQIFFKCDNNLSLISKELWTYFLYIFITMHTTFVPRTGM